MPEAISRNFSSGRWIQDYLIFYCQITVYNQLLLRYYTQPLTSQMVKRTGGVHILENCPHIVGNRSDLLLNCPACLTFSSLTPPHSLLNLIFELVTEIKLVFLHAVLFIRWHSLPLEDTLKKRGAHQGEQEAYQHHLSYQQLALSLLHIPFKYSQSTIVYRVDTLKHFWTIISVVLDVESVCWGKNLS